MKRLFFVLLCAVSWLEASDCSRRTSSKLAAIPEDRQGDMAGGISPTTVISRASLPKLNDFGAMAAIERGDTKALKKALQMFTPVYEVGVGDISLSSQFVDPVTGEKETLIGYAANNTALENRAYGSWPMSVYVLLAARAEKDADRQVSCDKKILDKKQEEARLLLRKERDSVAKRYDEVHGSGAYEKYEKELAEREALEEELERRACWADDDSGRFMA